MIARVVKRRWPISLWFMGAFSASILAQQVSSVPVPPLLEALPIRARLFAIFGAGGNIVVSIGQDGVLLVDTGNAAAAERVVMTVRQLQREEEFDRVRRARDPQIGAETRSTLQQSLNPEAPLRPIRFIINTHLDPEHVGGNDIVARAGRTYSGGNVAGELRDVGEGAAILAHENVLVRMSAATVTATGAGAQFPSRALPTDTYFGQSMKMSHFFNGEGVQLIHVPNGTTDGDSIVWFRGSDVIATGDLFELNDYPQIDVEHGGTVIGIVAGLNTVVDLSFAEFRTEGGTLIVPGHGRLADLGDATYYRDMITIVRDRVQSLVDKGLTLEQVQRARPTFDWDRRYGSANGDRFVAQVFRTLPKTSTKPAHAPAAKREGRTE